MSRPWRVIVHLSTFAKIENLVGDARMAREYATFAMANGCRHIDERGVETYWPTHMIHKIKVVPPGVELDTTTQIP